jgi:hypothetical protein
MDFVEASSSSSSYYAEIDIRFQNYFLTFVFVGGGNEHYEH